MPESTAPIRRFAILLGTFVAPSLIIAAALPGALQTNDDKSSVTNAVEKPNGADKPADSQASGIVGTKHDFSDAGRVPRDLCSPCHTPHITAARAPLLVKRSATIEPLRPYATKAGELNDASLVCLSCHDGTVARDVYAGSHAMSWSDLSAAGVAPGRTRLTNHPIGVKYPDGDAHYHTVSAVESDGRLKLPGGRIQCTTCHDPHNTERHSGMLVISNERSRLCLTCHRL